MKVPTDSYSESPNGNPLDPPWTVRLHDGGEDDRWQTVRHGDEWTCREFVAAIQAMGMPFSGGLRLYRPDGEVDFEVASSRLQ